jgi:hypothetical protein
VAEELTTPYDGEGHHFPIPKRLAGRLGLPKALRDSPLNVLKPRNMNKGDFYELHYRVDPKSNSNRLPDSVGGGSWKGRNIPGLRKYRLSCESGMRSPIILGSLLAVALSQARASQIKRMKSDDQRARMRH